MPRENTTLKFFCAQCKKWHPIGEIAMNLYPIAEQTMGDMVRRLIGEAFPQGNEKSFEAIGLASSLISFLQEYAEGPNDLFYLKGNEAERRLLYCNRADKITTGTLNISLQDCLVRMKASGSLDPEDEALAAEIPAWICQSYIFQQDLKIHYETVKNTRVLDRCSDINDSYFPDPKTKRQLLGYTRCCPYCGKLVSRAVGKAEEIVVLLAGNPRSGKTSSIAALASALLSGKYSDFSAKMQPFDHDAQFEELLKEVGDYDRGIAVTKTDIGLSTVPSYSFLVELGNNSRVLTFVDMPGEFWQSEDGLSNDFYQKYGETLKRVHCIWYFTSKIITYNLDLTLEQFDNLLVETSDPRERTTVARVNACFRDLRSQMEEENVVPPPILTILTKGEVQVDDRDRDRICTLLFPNLQNPMVYNRKTISEQLANRKGRMVLQEAKFYRRAKDTRQFFKEVNGGYTAAVEDNFSLHSYCAMSAYGHPAASHYDVSNPDEPTPLHELFPLLWTMAIMGAVEVEHGYYRDKRNLFGFVTDTEKGTQILRFDYRDYLEMKAADNRSAEARQQLEVLKDIAQNLLMEGSQNCMNEKLHYRATHLK